MSDENKQSIEEVLQEALIKNLANPKQIQSEAGMILNHSLTDYIAIDKYLEQKKANKAGMRFIKVEPK
ncbi:MAG: hypothetical protein LBL62_00485 [Planctomycetaceae bacterium]|jgi:hypothetical protein|nr:hypothetical protein [Planctomycetaceae bacterium]